MKETDLVGPARTEEIAEEFRKEHVEKIRTRWEHDIVRVRTLAHALHPKDEAETITSVEAARQENPWTAPKTTTRFRRRR